MKGITICGLGVDPRQTATLESLEALELCRTLFADFADAKQQAWLKSYFPGLRRAPGATEIVKAARGASVGLAVWGHPLFSPLARAVEAEAARKGVPCRLMAANSPVSTALARSQTFLGFLPKQYFGLQAYEAESFLSDPPRPARRLPLVVFSERVVDTRRLSAALARRWPSDHKVCVCPYDDGKLRLTSVKALAGDWDGRGAMVCIFP